MSTPSCSDGRRRRRRIPIGRYLLTVPIAVGLFLVLAIIEEHEVFFPPERPQAPGKEATAPVERVVRDLAAAIEAGYAGGSVPEAIVSPELGAEIAAEFEFARRRSDPPLRLSRLEVLRVDPAGDGKYTVTTDETWTDGDGEQASHLRWRYRVGGSSPRRVEEMVPLIPRPGDERR